MHSRLDSLDSTRLDSTRLDLNGLESTLSPEVIFTVVVLIEFKARFNDNRSLVTSPGGG